MDQALAVQQIGAIADDGHGRIEGRASFRLPPRLVLLAGHLFVGEKDLADLAFDAECDRPPPVSCATVDGVKDAVVPRDERIRSGGGGTPVLLKRGPSTRLGPDDAAVAVERALPSSRTGLAVKLHG